MKAVTFIEFGGPDVIEVREVDGPAPGADQVLVDVAAASINPVDVSVRSGGAAGRMPEGAGPPYVVGWDLAGHITAVGRDVDEALVGSYIVGFVPWFSSGRGAQAAQVVLGPEQFAVAAGGIPPEKLTTLGLNALTAYQVVEVAGLEAGTTVLVTGATGAVGGYVVEFASRRGATVWAMAADEDADTVRAFGAARVLPRSASDAVAAVAGEPADVVIDTAALGSAIIGAARDGGRYLTVNAPIESERGVEVRRIGVRANAAHLAEIVGLAASGDLALRVERTFPADAAAEAYRYFESGKHRGRVVLTF